MFLSVSLFLNLILFVAGIYLFLALRAQKKQLIKSFRNYLQGITALNISHLHDSANFFNLINKHLESRPPETIYNFAKGASFHFRALFEELKNNFDSYWQQSETDLPQFKNLYQKEQINLKDIFDMELFQISRFERLEFIDKSNSEYAFINGNFSLISKMFLNLLENALKYTDDKIKLELKSVADKWQVRISSFGKALPLDIIDAIQQKHSHLKMGHGLNSMMDIVEFHEASLEAETLAGDGTCIVLLFDKFYEKPQTLMKAKTTEAKNKFLTPALIVIFMTCSIMTLLLFYPREKQTELVHIAELEPIHKTISKNSEMPVRKKSILRNAKPKATEKNIDDLISQQDQKLNLKFEL